MGFLLSPLENFLLILQTNNSFNLFVALVFLLKLFVSLVEFVQCLVEFNLEAVDFFAVVSDVAISLVSNTVGLLGGILEFLNDGVELVCFVLKGLHLLPNSVHGD